MNPRDAPQLADSAVLASCHRAWARQAAWPCSYMHGACARGVIEDSGLHMRGE